jgi:hypothetical protein
MADKGGRNRSAREAWGIVSCLCLDTLKFLRSTDAISPEWPMQYTTLHAEDFPRGIAVALARTENKEWQERNTISENLFTIAMTWYKKGWPADLYQMKHGLVRYVYYNDTGWTDVRCKTDKNQINLNGYCRHMKWICPEAKAAPSQYIRHNYYRATKWLDFDWTMDKSLAIFVDGFLSHSDTALPVNAQTLDGFVNLLLLSKPMNYIQGMIKQLRHSEHWRFCQFMREIVQTKPEVLRSVLLMTGDTLELFRPRLVQLMKLEECRGTSNQTSATA